MNWKLIGIILVSPVFFSEEMKAQADTILFVDTITIRALSELPYGKSSSRDLKPDLSPDVTRNDLQKNGVYFRSYGPSGVGSISIRGGGANHTGISWNGTNIINPMLGQSDAAILPFSLFDRIRLYKGSESTLAGSGAVAGGIDLGDQVHKEEGLTAMTSLGSFGNKNLSAQSNHAMGSFHIGVSASLMQATNDFTYPLNEEISRRNEHGEMRTGNLMIHITKDFTSAGTAGIRFWSTNALRNIAPTTQQVKSVATLSDKAIRMQAFHQTTGKLISNLIQLTYVKDNNVFEDKAINELGDNLFTKMSLENRAKLFFGSSTIYASLIMDRDQAQSKNYEKSQTQITVAGLLGTSVSLNAFNVEVFLRQPLVVDYGILPIIPNLVINYRLDNFDVQTRVQRCYRFPSLNERFWVPGGNPGLLPETGWAQDLSVGFHSENFKIQTSAYNRLISNWVQWLPDQRFISSATNIAKVWSRGAEIEIAQKIDLSSFSSLSVTNNTSFNKSTNEVEIAIPKINKGDQLFYTPVWQSGSSLEYAHSGLRVSFGHQYFSKTNGINDMVKAYHLFDAAVAYHFKKDQGLNRIRLDCFNLFDVSYFTVERRAMPGRYINCSLQFSLE